MWHFAMDPQTLPKGCDPKRQKSSYTNSLHPSGLNILNTFELSWTFLKTSIFQIGCKIWQIWHSEIVPRFDVPGELMESVMPSSMPAMWRWGGVCIAMFTMFTMFAYCNILEPWQCILQSSIARQENKLCAFWDAQKPTHFLTSACRSCAHAKHAKHAKDWLNVKMTAHPDASG